MFFLFFFSLTPHGFVSDLIGLDDLNSRKNERNYTFCYVYVKWITYVFGFASVDFFLFFAALIGAVFNLLLDFLGGFDCFDLIHNDMD